MTTEIIDSSFLDSMAEKRPFIKKMFAVFVSQEPKRIQQIREALNSGDVDTLRHLAHSLKGGSATIGAERVKQACLLLEKATKANDMQQAQQCFSQLETEMHDTYAFMFDFMARE